MQRFYLPPELFGGDYIISRDQAFLRQLAGVLRAKEGERFAVFDGDGKERLVQLIGLSKKEAKFLIIDSYPSRREPSVKVNLFLALIKADKLEWAVQKAVELGAFSITPMICERSVARELSANKIKRLHDIIREATEQCGGSILAELRPLLPYHKAIIATDKNKGKKLIAWEEEQENQLKDYKSKEIDLFIGPEGGFSLAEINRALEAGFSTVSLGSRILRAETAPLVALSAILLS